MSESFAESEPAPPSSALPAFVTKNRLTIVEAAEQPVVAARYRSLVDDVILSRMDTPDPRKWGSALHLRRPAVAGGEWDVHIRRRSLASSSDDSEPSETSRSREIEIQLIDKQGRRGEYAHYRLDERNGAVRCLDSVTLDEKAARYKPDLFEVGNSEPGSEEMETAVEALTEEIEQAPQRPQSETGIDPDSRLVGSDEQDGLTQFITKEGWSVPATQEMIKKIWEDPSD